MIAVLSMYDRPETAAALDRFWVAFRGAYPDDAPDHLTRYGDAWDHWMSPDLLLAQTCGMPYRTRLHGIVSLVGTPLNGLDCPPGEYFSIIVARAGDPRDGAVSFDGARLAFNEPLSQSGWAAPASWAAAKGIAFGGTLRTGAHRASAEAVATGRADLAALDAVTWEMISRWDDVARELKVIDRTDPTPALPFITAAGRPPGPVYDALSEAIAGLSPEDRDLLLLHGVTRIPADAYLAVPTPAPPHE